MEVTTRGFYAIEVLTALARWKESLPMTLADIDKATGVPYAYGAKLLLSLRHAGVVASFRGNCGGYRLAMCPNRITLRMVFEAVGESLAPWRAVPPKPRPGMRRTRRPAVCPVHPVWGAVFKAEQRVFAGFTLADFLQRV